MKWNTHNYINWLYSFILLSFIGCINKVEQDSRSYVLQHASLINVINGEIKTDQTVIIEGNSISRIGLIDSMNYPDRAIIVDCNGFYLIPGLWDMHVHTQDPNLYSNLYIANGITGIRDMGGNDPDTKAALSYDFSKIAKWRERIINGELLGPRVIAARSIIDGPPGFWPGLKVVSNEKEAIVAVQKDKQAGADFIKVYSLLQPSEFKVVAAEAHKQGLEVSGHLSEYVSIEDALEAGQRTIEHFSEGRYLIIACSNSTDLGNRYLNAWVTDTDLKESWHNWLTLLAEAANNLDTLKSKDLIQLLANSESWQVPTWRLLRNELLDPSVPRPAKSTENYLPLKVKKMWAAHPLNSGLREDKELSTLANKILPTMRHLITEMKNANVHFMVGSDSGNPDLIPGFALHDELSDLVEDAGFSPLQALQMSTIRPAEFLGLENERGTLDEGKVADIVILRKNPLEDINNIREIETVIVEGKYLNRTKLDSLLMNVFRD